MTIDELAILESFTRRISELIRSSGLETPVSHLGRWKLRDLVAHLGGVHRWATRIVTDRSMDGPGFTQSKLDGIELCDWFDAGVVQLLEAFRVNGRDESRPNFNPGSIKTVAWWARRQMHETAVHCWDAEHVLDCTTPMDPTVAADGIDEYLDVFVRTRGKQTLIAPLILAATEPSIAWTLTPASKPGRLDIAQGRSADIASAIEGDSEKLLLTLWGRMTIAEAGLTVTGDPEIAESLFARS